MCSCFLNKFIGDRSMKKLKMTVSKLTFEEGCNRYSSNDFFIYITTKIAIQYKNKKTKKKPRRCLGFNAFS